MFIERPLEGLSARDYLSQSQSVLEKRSVGIALGGLVICMKDYLNIHCSQFLVPPLQWMCRKIIWALTLYRREPN